MFCDSLYREIIWCGFKYHYKGTLQNNSKANIIEKDLNNWETIRSFEMLLGKKKKKKRNPFSLPAFPLTYLFFSFYFFLFVGLMGWILNRKTKTYIIWGWEGAQVHIPGSEQNQTIYFKDFYSLLCSHTLFDSPIWHLESAYVRTQLGAEMFSWLLHVVNFYHGFAESSLVQKHFLSSSCSRSLYLSISLGFAFGTEVTQTL